MNQETKLWKLISRARAEAPPKVDVADRVLAALHAVSLRTAERSEPLLWIAAPAAVAAVVATVIGLSHGASWSDLVLAKLTDPPWWML